jgi:hypothetical protein
MSKNRPWLIACAVAVMMCTMGASCNQTPKTGTTTKAEMELTEANHEILMKAVPAPRLKTSQERKNLKRRLQTFNNESKVSYIYLVDYGKVMGFYTVKGKVSSVNSKLTTGDQIVAQRFTTGGSWMSHVIESPQLDGSYGENGDAIFFFTTGGTYVEWNGRYMLCDKPLKMSTPPQLVMQVPDN